MKDLLLIPILLAVFVFGYFVVAKVDRFIEENCRLIQNENRQNKAHIHIAAETPVLLDSIAAQLSAYSDANPLVEFFLSTGKTERILQKLMDGTLDIALLAGENTIPSDGAYALLRIPCRTGKAVSAALGLPVETIDEEKWVSVVWNRSIPSKSRDRVLFAIEAELCSLKCGYADYLR